MKNHFDISGSVEIREVDIAGVVCILFSKIVKSVMNIHALKFMVLFSKHDSG